MAKRKRPKSSKKKRTAAGGYDQKSRRKYDKGGRVEAYTMGEVLGKKDWP